MRAARHARMLKVRAWVKAYLKEHPCVDCGEPDWRVLEFDHIDPASKSFSISRGIADGRNIDSIKTEIKKCEVRCCNCHRIRTRREKHWGKGRDDLGGHTGDGAKQNEDNPEGGAA